MACADINMDIQRADGGVFSATRGEQSLVHEYKATEMMPDVEGPLHNLLQKQPAVLGSLQVMSGFFSVGVGIFFAVTQEMHESLFTLFRLSLVTGLLFVIAGIVSNLLFKYPGLLLVSFWVNCGCIIVSVVAGILVSVDLAQWNSNDQHLKLEIMALCVMGLEVLLSVILCFWFSVEKRSKSPR